MSCKQFGSIMVPCRGPNHPSSTNRDRLAGECLCSCRSLFLALGQTSCTDCQQDWGRLAASAECSSTRACRVQVSTPPRRPTGAGRARAAASLLCATVWLPCQQGQHRRWKSCSCCVMQQSVCRHAGRGVHLVSCTGLHNRPPHNAAAASVCAVLRQPKQAVFVECTSCPPRTAT
jgi:hypothetical protein